ncbi:MAG: hypothetical protein ACREEW_10070 [Caulobacteraceae bacterium]
MAEIWTRRAVATPRRKATSCVASMVFVAAMGAAFWIGTIWASQAWMAVSH